VHRVTPSRDIAYIALGSNEGDREAHLADLNQMVAVETTLAPHALLAALQSIERAAGRVRTVRWGPRPLDLDIVLFEHQRVAEPELTVPHPELPNRDFWRRELAELRRAG
jgi:2-amino-4-hydroxy-6-hydroxymethyldihydropteridine diphosphokinase